MIWNVNNVSTLATTIWVTVIAPILVAVGVQIDQTIGVAVITAILTLIFMIWNAKNPNEIAALGNAPADDIDYSGVDDEL